MRTRGRYGGPGRKPTASSRNEPVYHDGALDSLVCATVAHLYHHDLAVFHKLRHGVAGKVGRGPFYVVAPDAEPGAL